MGYHRNQSCGIVTVAQLMAPLGACGEGGEGGCDQKLRGSTRRQSGNEVVKVKVVRLTYPYMQVF